MNFVRTTVGDQRCLRSTAEDDHVVGLPKITNWRSAIFNSKLKKEPKNDSVLQALFEANFVLPKAYVLDDLEANSGF